MAVLFSDSGSSETARSLLLVCLPLPSVPGLLAQRSQQANFLDERPPEDASSLSSLSSSSFSSSSGRDRRLRRRRCSDRPGRLALHDELVDVDAVAIWILASTA